MSTENAKPVVCEVLDLDDASNAFAPIQVKLKGTTYTVVPCITQELLNSMGKMDETDASAITNSLSKIFGVPSSEFEGVDIRLLVKMVRYAFEKIKEQIEGKGVNPSIASK